MAQVGWHMRAARLMENEAAKPCSECGHRTGGHRELLAETWELQDGTPVLVSNPDYKPLHFHCVEEGCGCVILGEM